MTERHYIEADELHSVIVDLFICIMQGQSAPI